MALNKVTNIAASNFADNEYRNLLSKTNILEGQQKYQVISKALAISSREDQKNPNFEPSFGTIAFKLNHNTIKSFIESDSYGLGISWNSWIQMVDASDLIDRYNIVNPNNQDVINEYNDIVTFLNRAPFDADEYHAEKRNLLMSVKGKMLADHERELVSIQSDTYSMKSQLKESESALINMSEKFSNQEVVFKSKIKSINKENESTLTAMNDKISNQEIVFKSKIKIINEEKEAALTELKDGTLRQELEFKQKISTLNEGLKQAETSHNLELKARLEDQKSELNANFQIESALIERPLQNKVDSLNSDIDKLNGEFKLKLTENKAAIKQLQSSHENEMANNKIIHNSEVDEINKRIENNFISKDLFCAVKMELDDQRDKVLESLTKEFSLTNNISELNDKFSVLDDIRVSLEGTISELNSKIMNGDLTIQDIELQEVINIKAAHSKLCDKLTKLTEIATKQKERISVQGKEIKGYKSKIKKLKHNVKVCKSMISGLDMKSKIYLSSLAIVSSVATPMLIVSIVNIYIGS